VGVEVVISLSLSLGKDDTFLPFRPKITAPLMDIIFPSMIFS
jgi:hypothetical protein